MEHKEKNGAPQDHQQAKQLMAGFAAAAADRIIETKGLDFVDKERAKHEAKRQAEEGAQSFLAAFPSLFAFIALNFPGSGSFPTDAPSPVID